MKRSPVLIALLLISLFTLVATPANAQTSLSIDPVNWIPADFAAFAQIDMTNLDDANLTLNLGVYTAAVLQPARSTFNTRLSFDAFFPLIDLLDVEDASFGADVLPWLGSSMIVAYQDVSARFITRQDDVLLLLPVSDAFLAASYMQRVISAQDLLEQETYRGITIYLGDQVAFALTPQAVLIGSADLVRAALDVRAGEAAALTSDSLYTTIQEATADEDAAISAYLSRDAARSALAFLVGAGEAGTPILTTLGESLSTYMDAQTAESLILSGAVDGIGIQVSTDLQNLGARARLVVHTENAVETESSALDPAVLDMIPRSAIVVQSGGDAANAIRTGLVALPLANFAGTTLAAFPIMESVGAASGAVPAPTAEDIALALTGFTEALEPAVNLNEDILQNFTGSYALALLPRPNNPLAVIDSPVDILLIAQTTDAERASATVEKLTTLFESFSEPMSEGSVGDHPFYILNAPQTDEPLVSVGVVDNTVVIGTGDSPNRAMAALRGDNRLIDQARWQGLAGEATPTTYIDAGALLNLVIPSDGTVTEQPLRQIGITSRALGGDLLELDVRILLN